MAAHARRSAADSPGYQAYKKAKQDAVINIEEEEESSVDDSKNSPEKTPLEEEDSDVAGGRKDTDGLLSSQRSNEVDSPMKFSSQASSNVVEEE